MCGQKPAPFAHLQDDQIDQVDDGHHQGKEEETLRFQSCDGAGATEEDDGDPAEAILCWAQIIIILDVIIASIKAPTHAPVQMFDPS